MIKIKFNLQSAIIVIILAFAFFLRFIGTNPGYPPTHADEGITYSQGIAMVIEHSLDPKHGYGLPYNYPIIVPLINALAYILFFIPLSMFFNFVIHIQDILLGLHQSSLSKQIDLIFNNYVLGHNKINVLFWGRYLTAMFGTADVFLSYAVGKRLFKSYFIGILSALFVAINYREVLNSHIGLPDIYNAFFLLFTLYSAILLWEKKTLDRYLIAGIAISVYFSTKFQPFGILPVGLALLFSTKVKKIFNRNLLIMFLSMVTVIFFLNIFHIIHWPQTFAEIRYSALKYDRGINRLNFYPYSYLYHVGIGQLMSIILISGLVIGIKRDFYKFTFLLSVVIPFFWLLTYATGGGFYTRNFVSIIPVLLIFFSLCYK